MLADDPWIRTEVQDYVLGMVVSGSRASKSCIDHCAFACFHNENVISHANFQHSNRIEGLEGSKVRLENP